MTVRHDVAHMREVEEALRRSEAKYREISEKIHDIFFQTNAQGLIVEVSPSVERYGYTREEMIGMPAARVYEDPSKRITLLQLVEDGDITDREVRLRARDGRVVDFSISAHMLRGPDGAPAGMEGCLRDISDRKRAEEALRRSQRELAIRNKIADTFLTVPDQEMYGEALQVVLEALESRYGVFGYIDEDGAIVRASMARDIWDQCRVPDKDIVCPPEQWGGIWGRALIEKKSRYSNEPGRVPEGHIPILNSLAVPIIHRKRVIGLLHVSNKETGYDEDDKEMLETIAGHIAPILRARLQRDRQERRCARARSASARCWRFPLT
jgi:PAS domain S-box-containing protein